MPSQATPEVPVFESRADNADVNEGWKTVVDLIQDQDKETIDGWKDELNILLIFAGLFSAVVTAFTVDSYKWLQEDPQDTSVKLLTQISQQLSSFTVTNTVTNSVINSTIQPNTAPASFSAGGTVKSINILWIYSLTLSLMAAFFTLLVLKWLRQQAIPRYLSARDTARMRQWRHDGLVRWQVPTIIMVLPLLLQIAVVLFLVGFLVLLSTLDWTVYTAFAVLLGIGLFLFLAALIGPLLFANCPYKSPIVPAIFAILQRAALPIWAIVLLISAFTYVLVTLATLIQALMPLPATLLERTMNIIDLLSTESDAYLRLVAKSAAIVQSLSHRIRSYQVLRRWNESGLSALQYFWNRRELESLSKHAANLDTMAVSWALMDANGLHSPELRRSFRELSGSQKRQSVLFIVAIALGFHRSDIYSLGSEAYIDFARFAIQHMPERRERLSLAHIQLMLEALPMDDTVAGSTRRSGGFGLLSAVFRAYRSQVDDISLLLLLLHLATSGSPVYQQPIPQLHNTVFQLCSMQTSATPRQPALLRWRLPMIILCLRHGHGDFAHPQYSPDYLDQASAWAYDSMTNIGRALGSRTLVLHYHYSHMIEAVLASVSLAFALAADAANSRVSNNTPVNDILAMLTRMFADFIRDHRNKIKSTANLYETKREDLLLLATPTSIRLICKSFADFADVGWSNFSPGCPEVTIVDYLKTICESRTASEYLEAQEHLERLARRTAEARASAENRENDPAPDRDEMRCEIASQEKEPTLIACTSEAMPEQVSELLSD